MSWLNFNDSLNNIKGQISSFANTVLAENLTGTETDASNNAGKSETLKENKQQQDDAFHEDVSWSWSTDESKTDQLKTDETITNLKKKIIDLENENRELITSLDQLDQNHQQNTEELVKIKEKLSEELEIVTEKYEILNMKFNKLSLAENAYKKKINELKNKCEEISKIKRDSGRIQELEEENKALRIALIAKKEEQGKEDYEVLICKLEETQEKFENSQRCIEKLREILKDSNMLNSENETEDIPDQLTKLLSKFDVLNEKIFEITQSKTDLQNDKNGEIEKLIENSEMLTQELMNKSKEIKDLEEECMQLMRNNELLIEKLNESKQSQQLQTIFETNEDNAAVFEKLETSTRNVEELQEKLNETVEERDKLKENLEKTRNDFESSEYQFTEMKISFENLLDELEKHKTRIDLLENENENLKIQTEKLVQIEEFQEKINQLEEIIKLKDEENAENTAKIRQLEVSKNSEEYAALKEKIKELEQELINSQGNELKTEIETLKQLLETEKEAELKILQENEMLQKLNQEFRVNEEVLNEENAKLKREIEENSEKLDELSRELQKQTKLTEMLREKDEQNSRLKCEAEENAEKFNELSRELQKQTELSSEITEENKAFKQFQASLNEILGDENTETILEQIRGLKSLSETSSKDQDEIIKSRNELIALLQTKHQETLTYHAEIQRLTEILKNETEKNIELEKQIASSSKNQAELEKLNERIEFLTEKCEILTKNSVEASGKEAGLVKKLERLQTHLVEVEEHYTQELLQAEQTITLLQAKLNEVEQREKDSSTIYTSVSIRANQQNEVLQQQLQTLTSQRDEFKNKLLELEDENNVKSAALTNLQLVLEQFQRDKEADVVRETERIRKQVKLEQKIQEDLRKEIASLENQIKESKEGLQAASRLENQLEMSKNQTSSLKEEVAVLNEKLSKKDEELKRISGQTEGKVDKSLIKNLVIGFVTSNKNLNRDQTQILKIIATVLDFNEQDHTKVNLNQSQQSSWLKSLLSPYGDESQQQSNESLIKAFVSFLENESKPRVVPSLLPSSGDSVGGNTTPVSTPGSRKSSSTKSPSPIVLNEIALPTFSDFPQHRNSSSILKGVLNTNINN